ncbi:hypothetical protein [Leptolinea tardivitalis]|uniref:hypothetical protein n=1 Tax=Leptolinea tardivitalis TaxID=229920 RepID=UPI001111B130|nr:hypothetical protein [Leptolinea tardivitalis]
MSAITQTYVRLLLPQACLPDITIRWKQIETGFIRVHLAQGPSFPMDYYPFWHAFCLGMNYDYPPALPRPFSGKLLPLGATLC